jgi:FkbM family methyltransferase
MSWRTSGIVLAFRGIGRRSGFNRWIASTVGSRSYEDRFQRRMFEEIRPNDCVWDVGANVGLYSVQFSRIVGASGKVVAFEPSPRNLARLRSATASLENVVVVPMALGDTVGSMAFAEGSDAAGATSRVVGGTEHPTGATVEVEVRRGDDLVLATQADEPDVIKIDTEGFEVEVIRGLEQTLRGSKLRALFVEIHFALLNDRGLASAPAEIERRLKSRGFSCAWPDASHLVAIRSAR